MKQTRRSSKRRDHDASALSVRSTGTTRRTLPRNRALHATRACNRDGNTAGTVFGEMHAGGKHSISLQRVERLASGCQRGHSVYSARVGSAHGSSRAPVIRERGSEYLIKVSATLRTHRKNFRTYAVQLAAAGPADVTTA